MKFVFITDTHSRSLARFATCLEKLRKSTVNEKIVLFHGGDLLSMSKLPTYFTGGRDVINSFKIIRKFVDDFIIVPGNHEYHLAEEWFEYFLQETQCRCVITNKSLLRKGTEANKKPNFLKLNEKTAVLGLMTPYTATCPNNPLLENIPKTYTVYREIIQQINILKEKGVTNFSILSHLGFALDQELLRKLNEANLKVKISICGGHSHEKNSVRIVERDITLINSVPYAQGYTIIDETDLINTKIEFKSISDAIIPNSDIKEEELECTNKIKEKLSTKINPDSPIFERSVQVRITPDQIRAGNSKIANFTASKLKEFGNAQIALIPRGAILPKEKIHTIMELMEAYYLSNKMKVVYLNGVQLMQLLNKALKAFPGKNIALLQPSEGFKYEYDPKNFTVTSAVLNGDPIYANVNYRVLTTDWIYKKFIKYEKSKLSTGMIKTGYEKRDRGIQTVDGRKSDSHITIGEVIADNIGGDKEKIHAMFTSVAPCDNRVNKKETGLKKAEKTSFFEPKLSKELERAVEKPAMVDKSVECDL